VLTELGRGLEIRGPWPLSCPTASACRFFGTFEGGLGPVFVVERLAAESEVPAGVLLVVEAGDALRDFDLWEGGGPMRGDLADLGPSHALMPHVCEGGLALVPRSRQRGAERLPIPPKLAARAGLYSLSDAQAAARPLSEAVACRATRIPWP
jgi:hypothetical protein